MNYNNYPSIGIDANIKILQDALHDHLGFSTVDFYGRVQKVISKDRKGIVPEVHVSRTERKEVFYDDVKAPGGNVFFVDNNEHSTNNGTVFTAKVKIVFMLNLFKVKETGTFRPDSEIQAIVLKFINKLKIIEVTGIEKGIDNVLSEFNIERIKLNDSNPYHTFSVNGNLNYLFNCNH